MGLYTFYFHFFHSRKDHVFAGYKRQKHHSNRPDIGTIVLIGMMKNTLERSIGFCPYFVQGLKLILPGYFFISI